MGGPPTDTATIAPTRVTLMARPMAATTATAMLGLTGTAQAGVVVGVVGDAIDGIPRGVAITKCFAKKPRPLCRGSLPSQVPPNPVPATKLVKRGGTGATKWPRN